MQFLYKSLLVLATSIAATFVSQANAANIAGLTGSYVCLTNRNFAPFASSLVGASGKSSNVLSLINMDTLQFSGIVSVTTNWGQTSPKPVQSNIVSNGSFTISNGLISGSYTINNSFTAIVGGTTYSGTNSINMIPANSGNTLFISMVPSQDSAAEPETGICQKQ
jgi:hypothetical protein